MNNKQIQHLLAYLGYYSGAIDGDIGPQTRGAVRRFQEGFGGIAVDGDPGPETQQALKHAVAFGIPERDEPEAPVPDSDTGTEIVVSFWPRIKYFTRDEPYIACPCGKCGGFPVEPVERLMLNADAIREHFGKPLIPSSTVRCAAHNASLPGSAANSLHTRGKAMDFCIPGERAADVVAYVWTLPDVDECYAIDGSYVHMGVLKYA